MSLDTEIAKRNTLMAEYQALSDELKALEAAIDYSAIDAKRAELKSKLEELRVPIAAKELKELVTKYRTMPHDDTYEYRYVVNKLKTYQQTLLDAGVITKAII